jgi:hypothetical protein
MKYLHIYLITIALVIHTQVSFASDSTMDNNRLHKLILRFDAKPTGQKGYWQIQYKNIPIFIITSEKANRMRIIAPIASSENLPKETLFRMMQANFDSALDARYSIAKGKLWSAFIHPLSELTDEQFISGLAQTITLVKSYGNSYSSGALIFNGGDSNELNQKTYQDVLRKGQKI